MAYISIDESQRPPQIQDGDIAETGDAISSELDEPLWSLLFDTGLTVPDLTYPAALALQSEMQKDAANGHVTIITNEAAKRSKPRARPANA